MKNFTFNKKEVLIKIIFIITAILIIILNNKIANAYGTRQYIITKEEDIEAKNREYPSVIVSNYSLENTNNQTETVHSYIAKTKIYDVRHVVYNKEFAKYMGHKKDFPYIDEDLPEPIKAMQIHIITEGVHQRQYLSLLIDNDLEIDIPETQDHLILGVGIGADRMRKFTRSDYEVKNIKRNTPKTKEFYNFGKDFLVANDLRYNMNFFLTPNSKKGIGGNLLPIEFSKRYEYGLDYYKLSLTRSNYKTLETKNPELCLKKKGGRDLSDPKYVGTKDQIDDFYCFRISKKLIKKVLPLLKEIDEAKSKKTPFAPYIFPKIGTKKLIE